MNRFVSTFESNIDARGRVSVPAPFRAVLERDAASFGDIGGIPRLLDIGQCNDAYSAIQIAVALAEAFDTDVNSLPLSLVLSWYEQKAVSILLTLLHLGIKGIRLGPSLPAFITPNVLDVLVKNFDIKPITTPDEDLKAALAA